MRVQALAGAALMSWAAVGLAEEPKATDLGKTAVNEAKAEAPKNPPFTFALHGFTSGSVYVQDASLGPSEGQQSLYVNAQPPRQPQQDKLIFGGDVRQSRFNFSVAGPQLGAFGGAVPRAVLEIDFFGGFGSGNYGDVSLSPRMRFAYGMLDWGNHKILFGQTNDLIFTIAPASLAHIAFPYGYGSGNIGWRRPGVFGFHTFGDKKGVNAEFAWEVGRSQWADNGGIGNNFVTANGPGDAYGFSKGVASGVPAVEARLMVSGGSDWTLFTTGHYQRIDRSGAGAPPTTVGGISSDIEVVAVNAGAKLKVGPLQLAATGFVGKNLGPLVGNFLLIQADTVGDIHDKGGWVQAGFNLTKQLSIWGYIGAEVPDENDMMAARSNKLRNVTTTGMLQYRDSVKVAGTASDFAIAFEWIHLNTRLRQYASTTAPVVTAAAAASSSGDVEGNQWILSGNYFF